MRHREEKEAGHRPGRRRELTRTTRSGWSSESRFSTVEPSRTGLTAGLTGDTRHRGEGADRTRLGLSRALNCRGETWTSDSVFQSFVAYSGLGGGQRQTARPRCFGRKVWRHPTRVRTKKYEITHNQITQKNVAILGCRVKACRSRSYLRI